MLCQLYCLSISKLPKECFPKEWQNVLKRNRLVVCHTDLVLKHNVDINIFRPDMIETYP